MKRDFTGFAGLPAADLQEIWSMTETMKRSPSYRTMENKTAALIFEKQSLRTHVSFEVGIAQLGGRSVFLSQQHIGVGTREPIEDIAGVLSRYNDLIIARTMAHDTVTAFAAHASIPVIRSEERRVGKAGRAR